MFAFLITAAVVAAPPPAEAPPLKPTMRDALAATIAIQPLLANPIAFRDKANAEQLRGALAVLSKVEHAFTKSTAASVPAAAMATLFAKEIDRAKMEFDSGDPETARTRLRSVTTLCYGCHVREPTPADSAAAGPLADSLKLPPLDRARFFASTRQFDRAFAEWNKVFATKPKSDQEALDQALAVRFALAVAVQGKDDPALAASLLEKNKARVELPAFMRQWMASWLDDVKAWQAEGFVTTSKQPAELVAKARALLDATTIAKFPSVDDSKFVTFLRAGTYLQEALRKEPAGAFRGEALYLLGLVNAAPPDTGLWRLEWLTLEACIRENPKTPLARQCFERLRDRTYFSYTSRGGVEVPSGVAGELSDLRPLAP